MTEQKLFVAIGFTESVATHHRYNTTITPSQYVKMKYDNPKRGYRVHWKEFHYLLALVSEQYIQDIPRKRIDEYRYVTVEQIEKISISGNYFIVEVDENDLKNLEKMIKDFGEYYPRIFLARDGQWYSFPHFKTVETGETEPYFIETYDYVTKTKNTIQRERKKTKAVWSEEYEPYSRLSIPVPLKAYTEQSQIESEDGKNPAGFPTRIVGNGMILEWKQGYEDKPPIWWLRDEYPSHKSKSQTYKNYSAIKSTFGAKWSKGFSAWYFASSPIPPASWLRLVGYTTENNQQQKTPIAEKPIPDMPEELVNKIEKVIETDQKLETPAPVLPIITPQKPPSSYPTAEKTLVSVDDEESIFG